MSVSEIVPDLYIGSKPPATHELAAHFDVLVLSAKEYQPENRRFGRLRVIHAPIDDDHRYMPSSDKLTALNAAMDVASLRRAGKKILVTCWEGHNRSSLIVALALMLGKDQMPLKEVAARIHHARGHDALSNPHFRTFLKELAARLPPIKKDQ